MHISVTRTCLYPGEVRMCEFNVFLGDRKVFENVIYAKTDGGKAVLTDILGMSKEFQDCQIREIDVASERLVLSPTEKPLRHSTPHHSFNKTLERAAEFHGHLGPFLAIGVRMGLLAKKILNSNGFSDLHVIVNTGNNPPLSCVVDGIQVATGCTMGKGNISVRNLNDISALFHTKRQAIRVKMKMEVFQSLKNELLNGDPEKMEETARKVSSMHDTKLFRIDEVTETL